MMARRDELWLPGTMAKDCQNLVYEYEELAITDEEREVAKECVKAKIRRYFQDFIISPLGTCDHYIPWPLTTDGKIDRSDGEFKFEFMEDDGSDDEYW